MRLYKIARERIILLITLMVIFTANSNGNGMHKPDNVEKAFKTIIGQYASGATTDSLWNEVVSNYSGPTRHYHTLEHLDNFYTQLNKCRKEVSDWKTMVIAMVYHDVIYNSTDHKDEERSAEMAVAVLKQIGYPEAAIKKCEALILATKTHAYTNDNDTNLFNDADMSILGLSRDVYQRYIKNVRLEYGDTPQFDAGRKKVLKYFLTMDKIFKTPIFNALYEKEARSNIEWEITTLP